MPCMYENIIHKLDFSLRYRFGNVAYRIILRYRFGFRYDSLHTDFIGGKAYYCVTA